jgi:arylsulfotransferase ASST
VLAHRRGLRGAAGPAGGAGLSVRGRGRLAVLLALAASGCGPTAEILSLNQSEVMNVSAWVTAHVTGAEAVRATASSPGAQDVVSADLPIKEGEAAVALLGLRPDRDYQVKAVAVRTDIASVLSEAKTFRTGSTPAGLPTVGATGDGLEGEWTLVGMVNATGATHGAMVVNGLGEVVWYHVTDNPVTDFQRQPDGTYTAAEVPASGSGAHFDQFDREGRLLRVWTAPPESASTDWHELRLLPGNLALIAGTQTRVMDLSALGGSASATVVGNVLYRVQADGQVVFRWNAFDHLAVDDLDPAVDVTQGSVDWTHVDAVDVAPDGGYLLTFRNLSQVVKIDAVTGAVIWRLGGKRSDFTFPDDPLGGPSFPHGARELANGNVLLFDNGNGRATQESRAVEYALDRQSMQARVAWQYAPSPPRHASDLGFAQRTSAGTTLVTFGTEGHVDEVDGTGAVKWSLQSSDPAVPIYRAIRIDTLY